MLIVFPPLIENPFLAGKLISSSSSSTVMHCTYKQFKYGSSDSEREDGSFPKYVKTERDLFSDSTLVAHNFFSAHSTWLQ